MSVGIIPWSAKHKPPSSTKTLSGWACHYGVDHSYKGRIERFDKNCFAGSMHDVFFGIDHKYSQKKLADQSDGSLELLDTDVGIAFRFTISHGDLERLDGRSEASVSYIEGDVELRNGVRVIKSAILFEISACHIATMRGTHCIVRDANNASTLAEDAKSNFESDAAFTKVMAALRRIQ